MADGNPKYEKVPRPESISFFEKSTQMHKCVSNISLIKPNFYEVIRSGKHSIFVQLNNLYIVGVADVHEIISTHSNINCIVTISNWNSYSNEAKDLCKKLEIGLFRYYEYYGALYFENERFYNYEPPKDKD